MSNKTVIPWYLDNPLLVFQFMTALKIYHQTNQVPSSDKVHQGIPWYFLTCPYSSAPATRGVRVSFVCF